jgi:hypothetical protein
VSSSEPMEITPLELSIVARAIDTLIFRIYGGPRHQEPIQLSTTKHWIVIGIGGRTWGYWRTSMDLYEADENGAMGTEPVSGL